MSDNGPRTLCIDDDQVITYEYFDGYALTPPIYDVNYMKILLSYSVE
jgi:hypothetical protein